MSAESFALDERLAADTLPVISLPLCDVLLMNDSRYPWLILVPRRGGLVEVFDLDVTDQAQLWREVSHASAVLREFSQCEKLNLGALGNIVRQLHVHVVARRSGDTAWPGVVWGNGNAVGYPSADARALIETLRNRLLVN